MFDAIFSRFVAAVTLIIFQKSGCFTHRSISHRNANAGMICTFSPHLHFLQCPAVIYGHYFDEFREIVFPIIENLTCSVTIGMMQMILYQFAKPQIVISCHILHDINPAMGF